MSGLCLVAGLAVTAIAGDAFQLFWIHSVEKVTWREEWLVEGGLLHLQSSGVKGSGAGMEPGPGALLSDGWWVWTPDLPPQAELVLAASGATPGGWTLCDATHCLELGRDEGAPVILRPCPDDAAPQLD